MSEFWIFFERGLRQMLDLSAYDPILFLVALTIPYTFKDWKKLLLLVLVLIIGHTVIVLLSILGVLTVKINLLKVLIPTTILVVALFDLVASGKSAKQGSISVPGLLASFFGILYGLSYVAYFKVVMNDALPKHFVRLSGFSLGIALSYIILVFMVLLLSYIVQTFFRCSKRDWTLVLSSFIIGVVLPMIISSEIWNR